MPVLLHHIFGIMGLQNSSEKVRNRVAYIFSRLSKLLGPILHGYLPQIASAILGIVSDSQQTLLAPSARQTLLEGLSVSVSSSINPPTCADVSEAANLVVPIVNSTLERGRFLVGRGTISDCETELIDCIGSLTGLSKGFDRLRSYKSWANTSLLGAFQASCSFALALLEKSLASTVLQSKVRMWTLCDGKHLFKVFRSSHSFTE